MNKIQTLSSSRLLRDHRLHVGLILLVALLLRLGHVLFYTDWPDLYGGDYRWFADFGSTLVRTGWTPHAPQTGPVFLLVAGYAEQLNPQAFAAGQPAWLLHKLVGGQVVFPDPLGGGLPAVRLLHAFLSTLSVLMVYRIGRAAWNQRAGLIAGGVIALSPAFIIEAGNPTTETIAMFFMLWATALWLERIEEAPDWRLMAATSTLIALGALTRSVFIALPGVFGLHLWARYGFRQMAQKGIILALAFLITVSPWTLYNAITWGRFTLTGEGVMGMLYVGAVGWKDPAQVDRELGFEGENASELSRQESYQQGFVSVLLSDPAGYALRRVRELGSALLQPHNTTFYHGESIKTLVLNWLRDDRTPGGLLALTGATAFWQKLLLYLFHYAGLLAGIAGMFLNRRRWRMLAPLYLVFLYFLGIHMVLSAIPRYLFPLEPFFWLFAAGTFAALGERSATGTTAGGAVETPSTVQ